MRYVFLDVDGVLNHESTKRDVKGLASIDLENLAVFAHLMEKFYEKYGKENVRIILSSSWRCGENKKYDAFRSFLDDHLLLAGLHVYEETPMITEYKGRGIEIATYLSKHLDDLEGYLVLDDYYYCDFKQCYCTRHWLRTSYYDKSSKGGLQERHIKKALEFMDTPIKEDEIYFFKHIDDMYNI